MNDKSIPQIILQPELISKKFKELCSRICEALEKTIPQTKKYGPGWDQFQALLQKIINIARENPKLVTFILTTAVVALSVPLLLEIAGFGIGGVVEGSFAAAWQSEIGNVAANSLFSWLQSIGATGLGYDVGAAAGVLVSIAGFGWVDVKRLRQVASKAAPKRAMMFRSLL